MIALIQRVSRARVLVDGKTTGNIEQGLLVFLGVEKQDTSEHVQKLITKVLGYRIFADEQGKMNLNVQQVGGALLVVSQFTLAAETNSGLRPSFSNGAPPTLAQSLYSDFITQARAQNITTQCGEFGAHMQVELTNDGPVTFWLQV